jgi:hypothetical protein
MKEDFVMIQVLVKRGVCQQDIATMLGVRPKTVRRALARDGAPTGPAKRGSLLLDPYKPRVDDLLQDGVWNGVVIWRELQGMGHAAHRHPRVRLRGRPAMEGAGQAAWLVPRRTCPGERLPGRRLIAGVTLTRRGRCPVLENGGHAPWARACGRGQPISAAPVYR